MEFTFVADYDYDCPYCMGRTDYVEGNIKYIQLMNNIG